MSETRIDPKEIAEAVNAANDALYHLGNADEVLRSAKNWGLADILGGKMIITGIKHSRMNEAENHLRAAQNALDILATELKDVGQYFELESVASDGLMIMDFVFDNFFTDLITQQKITNARKKVQDAIAQVEGILDALIEIQASNS